MHTVPPRFRKTRTYEVRLTKRYGGQTYQKITWPPFESIFLLRAHNQIGPNMTKFDTYEQLHNELNRQMSGDERHSISQQVAEMLVEYEIVGLLIAGYRISRERKENSLFNNGYVSGFINNAYLASQFTKLRRLTEQSFGDESREIISINRLLSTIRSNRTLIQRKEFISFHMDQKPKSITQESWDESRLHTIFDEMSMKRPDSRKDHDYLHKSILTQLEEATSSNTIQNHVRFANKFALHSADVSSRSGYEDMTFTHSGLREAYRLIFGILNDISRIFQLNVAVSWYATPQDDMTAFFDFPVLQRDALSKMQEKWQEITSDFQDTSQHSILRN